MATETGNGTTESDVESEEGFSPYMRGVTVTTTATLAGILAALLSTVEASGPGDPLGGFFLLAAIVLQFPFYNLIGIDTEDFGGKDFLYIIFMTFTLWFIAWTVLLTAGTETLF